MVATNNFITVLLGNSPLLGLNLIAKKNMAKQQPELEQAIQTYKQQLSKQPTAKGYANLGTLYLKQGSLKEAMVSYQQALSMEPQFAGAYRNLGRLMTQMNQPEVATEYWYKAFALEPEAATAPEHLNLADTLLQQGKEKKALSALLRTVQVYPQFIRGYLRLGEILADSERPDKALACYRLGIEKNPNSPSLYCRLGNSLIDEGKVEDAVTAYQKAIALDANFFVAYQKLGNAFTKQERYEEAIKAYRRCIQLNPNFIPAHRQLGLLLIARNEEEAVQAYSRAIELNPEEGELYYQLGKVLKRQGKTKQAIDCYGKALSLNSNLRAVYTELQYTPIHEEQLDPLIAIYEKIVAEQPNFALAWGNLGDALAEKGRISEAIHCYQRSCKESAIELEPRLADLEWKQGKEKAPDFIIIGGARCGTSSLYQYLKRHPQVLLPHKKELHFFDQDSNFNKGVNWYLAQFPSITDREDLQTGEATPSYLEYPQIAARMKALFPQVKLIVLLRNPVQRSVSWHYHQLVHGFRKGNLEAAIEREMEQLAGLTESELRTMGRTAPNNILGGLYVYRLQTWMSLFPRDQILLLKSEAFWQEPAETMKQVFAFLGLPPLQFDRYPKHNIGSYPEIEGDLKARLADFFAPHNQKLEEYLGMEFSWDGINYK